MSRLRSWHRRRPVDADGWRRRRGPSRSRSPRPLSTDGRRRRRRVRARRRMGPRRRGHESPHSQAPCLLGAVLHRLGGVGLAPGALEHGYQRPRRRDGPRVHGGHGAGAAPGRRAQRPQAGLAARLMRRRRRRRLGARARAAARRQSRRDEARALRVDLASARVQLLVLRLTAAAAELVPVTVSLTRGIYLGRARARAASRLRSEGRSSRRPGPRAHRRGRRESAITPVPVPARRRRRRRGPGGGLLLEREGGAAQGHGGRGVVVVAGGRRGTGGIHRREDAARDDIRALGTGVGAGRQQRKEARDEQANWRKK